MIGIFIFRRDFRLYDNIGLNTVLKKCKKVIPIFIFDPRQIDNNRNSYFTNNSVQFMIESLHELDSELHKLQSKLHYFYGNPIKVLKEIHKHVPFDLVGMNMDYTPFSSQRDSEIINWCNSNNLDIIYAEDITLLPIGSIRTKEGTIYKKFTPFFEHARTFATPSITPLTNKNFKTIEIANSKCSLTNSDINAFYKDNPNIAVHGGRKAALHILNNIIKFTNYNKERDYPSISSTKLSAYLKYGCISIREFKETIVKTLGENNDLLKQLYWREFYYNIAYEYPHVFGNAFKPKYNEIEWENRKDWFKAWCDGQTGCPFVDAGMRQLNETGFMHNRLRMVVSMFLTKDLLIDWRWGERYFAQKLVDYDPCQNNGGWQWSASTGTDSQPYFRIFNPYTMSKRLDPDAVYIKQWVKELKDVDKRDLWDWENKYINYPSIHYPKPIINHKIQREKALHMFKDIS